MSIKLNKRGFTLIEVVLVLAIGGLIFAMAFLAYRQTSANRRDTQRRADLNRIVTELQNYYGDKSAWPDNSPGGTAVAACTATSNTFTVFIQKYLCDGGTAFLSPDGTNYMITGPLSSDTNTKNYISYIKDYDCNFGSNPNGVFVRMGLEKGGSTCKVIK